MRVCFIALDDMLTEWMVDSIECAGHECHRVVLNNIVDSLPLAVLRTSPELIVYAGPAGGPYEPGAENLRLLRDIAPSVFLCFDASDVGWWPLLGAYRRAECFDLVVNCDGCNDWPKLPGEPTLASPVGDSFYAKQIPFLERPIKFGFCGGHRSDPRYSIVSHLVRNAGLQVRARDDRYGGYQAYADFMRSCQAVLNVCYSAGGPHGQDRMTKQIKARVVETGFAGACLLETRGSPVQNFFTPGVDYLTYESKEEAEHIIKSASVDYLQRCAANLHAKIHDKFGPKAFWGTVLGALKT